MLIPNGYRPGKSTLDAVGQARKRCWRYDWVLDLDIKSFFDSLSQDLLLRAVRKHAPEQWIVLYIERWLKAPVQDCAQRSETSPNSLAFEIGRVGRA